MSKQENQKAQEQLEENNEAVNAFIAGYQAHGEARTVELLSALGNVCMHLSFLNDTIGDLLNEIKSGNQTTAENDGERNQQIEKVANHLWRGVDDSVFSAIDSAGDTLRDINDNLESIDENIDSVISRKSQYANDYTGLRVKGDITTH